MLNSKRKYNADALQTKINDYFEYVQESGEMATIEDLQTFLDISPNTWDSYANPDLSKYNCLIDGSISKDTKKYKDIEKDKIDKLEAAEIIKKTSRKILAGLFQAAFKDSKKTALAIYLSKQKAYGGYTDRQGLDVSGEVPIQINIKGASGGDYKMNKSSRQSEQIEE